MAEQIIGFSGHTPANLAVTTLLSSWFFGKLLDESDAWRSDIIPVQVHFAGNVEELVLSVLHFLLKLFTVRREDSFVEEIS